MPCYHPVLVYRSSKLNENGKRPIVFNPKGGYVDLTERIPCGWCIGCRIDKARSWTSRLVLESELHEVNSFVTLTYNDEYLPGDGSLRKRDVQLFLKRLRHHFPLRYYMVGEYGEQLLRPHYHGILFGVDFADKVPMPSGKLYISDMLQETWGKGFCTVGNVTTESCGYVARYVMKKITGARAESHYEGRLPEFALMSRRPGIAKEWFDQFSNDTRKDFIVSNGSKYSLPRYFDKLMDGKEIDRLKIHRRIEAKRKEKSQRELLYSERYRELISKNQKRRMEII